MFQPLSVNVPQIYIISRLMISEVCSRTSTRRNLKNISCLMIFLILREEINLKLILLILLGADSFIKFIASYSLLFSYTDKK